MVLPSGVAACYALTPWGLQILVRPGLSRRRTRIAVHSIELMVAQRWSMAVLTDEDLARAADRVDRALLREQRH